MVFSLRIGEPDWPTRFYQITPNRYSSALDYARSGLLPTRPIHVRERDDIFDTGVRLAQAGRPLRSQQG
jgi:hypothetical protein